MKHFDWDKSKNKWLKAERGVCFEDVIQALNEGNELARISHPNKKMYPDQKMIIVNLENYTYMVPFIENEEKVFLKTIIPSRKMTKKYLIEKS